MGEISVSIEQIEPLLDPGFIKDINYFVTENDIRRKNDKQQGMGLSEGDKSIIPDIDISKEDDYFQVIHEGQLSILRQNLRYEFGDEADLIELVSYIIEHFAQSQIFGNGNKRTAFLTGYFILLFYQIMEDYEEIVLFSLTDEFVELISNVAIHEKNQNRHDIQEFLSQIEERINQNSAE